MPSARSTLTLVAALAYGISVMAMPMQDSYDLVERDYSDLAELDARMHDTDIEEYYLRDVTTPPVAAPVPPPDSSVVSTHHHHKGSHRHSHGHKQHHKHHHGDNAGNKGEVAPTTTTDSLSAPIPSPDAANSKLSAREPRRGKGGKRGRGKGRRHGHRHGRKRGRKGPPSGVDAPAEPIAKRGLFSKKSKKTADDKATVTSETTPKAEEKEVDAAMESSPATPSTASDRKHKHKHSRKAGRRHGLRRLHRHRLNDSSKKPVKPSPNSSATAALSATV